MLNEFPLERQWDLLREHGLHEMFSGQWIETDDLGDAVRRMGLDPDSGSVCDFATAMESHDFYSREVVTWLGEHAPGWAHMLTLSGPMPPRDVIDALSAGQRRVFDVFFVWETGNLHNLYNYDGVCIGDVSPPIPAEPARQRNSPPVRAGWNSMTECALRMSSSGSCAWWDGSPADSSTGTGSPRQERCTG